MPIVVLVYVNSEEKNLVDILTIRIYFATCIHGEFFRQIFLFFSAENLERLEH